MSSSTDGPKTLMLLPLDCIVKVLSLIDCPKATMRLCQACRTFGYRLPASEREKGVICEATQLWQAVLARKWGAPVAHTPAECWYNEVRKPAESFARTLSMPISVRAFREADKHTRAAAEALDGRRTLGLRHVAVQCHGCVPYGGCLDARRGTSTPLDAR